MVKPEGVHPTPEDSRKLFVIKALTSNP